MTTKFVNSLSNVTYTENNAVSNKFADLSGEHNGIISLFYKTIRGIDKDCLYKILDEALKENLIYTFIISMYVRDCRGGKGEREIGRFCLLYLAEHKPEELLSILDLIPEYGRYDDLVYLTIIDEVKDKVFDYIKSKLDEDVKNMNDGKPVSLLAKWLPTERLSLDEKTLYFTRRFCKYCNINYQDYRKKYLTPLREYINIVERLMCNNAWDDIDYSKVPSCAMRKLRKAFLKRDEERFKEWQQKVKSGESKVCAKQLFIYELIKDIIEKDINDTLLEEQWKVLVEETKKLGIFSNSLVVCDVSGSMNRGTNITPLYASIGLGLLISSCLEGPLKNNLITFSESPVFTEISGSTLYEKVENTRNMAWGGNTDLQKVFELILNAAIIHNLKQEDMPNKVYILSDMQFDEATSRSKTNYQNIKEKYKNCGYDLPSIIFWNLNGWYKDFPITVDDDNTALISGYSTSIMKAILSTGTLSVMNIINEAVNDKRYEEIRNRLTKKEFTVKLVGAIKPHVET